MLKMCISACSRKPIHRAADLESQPSSSCIGKPSDDGLSSRAHIVETSSNVQQGGNDLGACISRDNLIKMTAIALMSAQAGSTLIPIWRTSRSGAGLPPEIPTENPMWLTQAAIVSLAVDALTTALFLKMQRYFERKADGCISQVKGAYRQRYPRNEEFVESRNRACVKQTAEEFIRTALVALFCSPIYSGISAPSWALRQRILNSDEVNMLTMFVRDSKGDKPFIQLWQGYVHAMLRDFIEGPTYFICDKALNETLDYIYSKSPSCLTGLCHDGAKQRVRHKVKRAMVSVASLLLAGLASWPQELARIRESEGHEVESDFWEGYREFAGTLFLTGLFMGPIDDAMEEWTRIGMTDPSSDEASSSSGAESSQGETFASVVPTADMLKV